jgi:hypothetical protein
MTMTKFAVTVSYQIAVEAPDEQAAEAATEAIMESVDMLDGSFCIHLVTGEE